MKNSKEGRSCSNNGGLFLLAETAERKGRHKEMEDREKASLFPFLKNTRYRSRLLGWPEAVARCHAMLPLVKSVCVKKLTATDIKSHHNRLLIPKDDVHDLVFKELNEGERQIVCDEGGKGLLVPTLDEKGRQWALVFSYWSSNRAYILKKDWFKLAYSNGFQAYNDVELLTFRRRTSGRLCFVVIRPPATVMITNRRLMIRLNLIMVREKPIDRINPR